MSRSMEGYAEPQVSYGERTVCLVLFQATHLDSLALQMDA